MTREDEVAIEFKGRGDAISARMQSNAARKLLKLHRFDDRIVRMEVVADHAHEDPEVELIVHLRRGKPLVAKVRGDTFSAVIDVLVEKMERQLKKRKGKQRSQQVPGSRRERGRGARQPMPRGEETYEEVVRRSLRG